MGGMNIGLLTQCDRVLSSCGRPHMPKGMGWVDIPYKMQYQKFLLGQTLSPSSTPVTTEEKIVDTEVPFILYGISAFGQPATPGALYWRLRLPNGRFLHSKESAFTEMCDFGSWRMWFDSPLECAPGSKFFVTVDSLVNNASLATGLSVVFDGALRYTLKGNPAGVATQTAELCNSLPRYTLSPNQNIMAPEWRLGNQCYPETPAGFRDEFSEVITPLGNLVSLPWTGAIVPNVPFAIDAIGEFRARFLAIQKISTTGGTANGTIAVRIRTDTGYEVTDGFTLAPAISSVVFPSLSLKPGGALYIDYMVVDGSGTASATMNVQTVLSGIKRRRGY